MFIKLLQNIKSIIFLAVTSGRFFIPGIFPLASIIGITFIIRPVRAALLKQGIFLKFAPYKILKVKGRYLKDFKSLPNPLGQSKLLSLNHPEILIQPELGHTRA